MSHKKNHKSQGQALVEFALIITVLLMMIFLIIESARILWAWNTVQTAAREGARYAITGRFDDPCSSTDLPKFAAICDDINNTRVASIIKKTHQGLSGLPLDETSGAFEDDNYYQIEVYGADMNGQILPNFGGVPNSPVIVRAYYRVPIITPLLTPIVPSVPVFSQVTMYNESFGQLGNANQGVALPPELGAIPTVGVTPSPTFTPTPGPTDTPTSTYTPAPTSTPDYCGLQFEGSIVADNNYVRITGFARDLNDPLYEEFIVTIIDNDTGATLGSGILGEFDGHACSGFVQINFPPGTLVPGHLIIAESNSFHSVTQAFVRAAPPTATSTSTSTIAPTATASNTPTPTSSPTPGQPYITLLPTCGTGPNIQFDVRGANWPQNESINLYWDSNQLQSTINTGSFTFFLQSWNLFGVADGTYEVVAVSANHTATATFTVPCPIPPTATPITATPTNTPEPADLIVVGPPELISTPPIVAYEPVDFRVVISNTGGIEVSNQFFVDVYLDPTIVLTTSIPITQSGGYQGVGSLAGGESRALTITVPLGFENTPEDHQIYSMVDSLEQINESIETNNISELLTYNQVTPAVTPTPSPTPQLGVDNVIGIVYRPTNKGLSPLLRANVFLVDAATSAVIATTTSDPYTGIYFFTNLPQTTYNVYACGTLSTSEGTIEYFGLRTAISLPYPFPVNIYTNNTVPCP